MTIREIVESDYKTNQIDNFKSPDEHIAKIEKMVASGWKIFRYKNILVTYLDLGDGGVRFHVVNGGMSIKELEKSLVAFALTMRDRGYQYIETYYNNPRNVELFKRSKVFPIETTETDGAPAKYKTVARIA